MLTSLMSDGDDELVMTIMTVTWFYTARSMKY